MNRRRALLGVGIAILAAQAAASHRLSRATFMPTPPPLADFPAQLGEWSRSGDGTLEAEIREALEPDDFLIRNYRLGGAHTAGLTVLHYRTQLRAKNAHDPKVCLPGSGWNPRVSRVIPVAAPTGETARVNYYRIARGGDEAVVLYWFQTHNGAYARDQEFRFRRVIDAMLHNRTDMALVRIVVPVGQGGIDRADRDALSLARLVYPAMSAYFPKEKSGS